jgi:hypothetical protein
VAQENLFQYFEMDTLVLKHKSVEMHSLAKPCLYWKIITEWHYISVPRGSAWHIILYLCHILRFWINWKSNNFTAAM